jgi:CO/xanthine dehydrogenase Mo-binding subunit
MSAWISFQQIWTPIGNAIFAAVGARPRHLPIRSEALLQEMKAGKAT